jgi:HEAT repeat protein
LVLLTAKDALKEYTQSCDSRANIKISVEQTVAMFIEDLSLPDDASRWYAALGLGFMGKAAQPAIPALKNLLKDQSWNLQQEACRSLGKIGTTEALDALEGYIEDCPQKVYN